MNIQLLHMILFLPKIHAQLVKVINLKLINLYYINYINAKT